MTLRLGPAFQNPVDEHIKIHVQLKTSPLVGVYILQGSFRTAMINRVILNGQMQATGLLLTVLHPWTGPTSKFSKQDR